MGWLNKNSAPVPVSVPVAQKTFADCSGCSLCLLVCPVWRSRRDLRMTPHGRAKALQHGASAVDLVESLDSCSLCGACQPMCPENIDLIGMTLDLRRALIQQGAQPAVALARATIATQASAVTSSAPARISRLLVPDPALRQDRQRLSRIEIALGGQGKVACVVDDGADLSLALESGTAIPPQRLARFLAPLRQAQEIVLADGLLLYELRRWLPNVRMVSLGEALSRLEPLRRKLHAGDLYVIEPRAYHNDFQRLVLHYERLRSASGCTLSLDLQRKAIPATSPTLSQRLSSAADTLEQARWLLHGRTLQRIVVENMDDLPVLASLDLCPVLHVADLLEDEKC